MNFSNFPTPNNQSTFGSAMGKAEVLMDTFSVLGQLWNQIILFVIAALLVFLVHFPALVMKKLVVVEIVAAAVVIGLRLRSRKRKQRVLSENDSNTSGVLAVNAYYDLLVALVQGVALVVLLAVVWLERQEFAPLRARFPTLTVSSNTAVLFVVVVAAMLLMTIADRFIKYVQYKKLNNRGDLASTTQAITIAKDNRAMIGAAMAIIVWAVLSLVLHIPFFFFLILASFSVLAIVVSNAQKKRTQAVRLETVPEQAATPTVSVPLANSQTQVRLALYGVLNADTSMVGGTFGVGIVPHPENTVLLLDEGLLFIQVPVTGGNQVVGGVPFALLGSYWNQGEIKHNGEALLATKGLDEIKKYAREYVPFTDIESVELSQSPIAKSYFALRIQAKGKKYVYQCADAGSLESFKQLLVQHVGDRLHV